VSLQTAVVLMSGLGAPINYRLHSIHIQNSQWNMSMRTDLEVVAYGKGRIIRAGH